MSIDAVVTGISATSMNDVALVLGPRCGSAPGQYQVHVKNPTKLVDMVGFIGCEIWGNGSQLLIGERAVLSRTSYCEAVLLPNWKSTIENWRLANHLATFDRDPKKVQGLDGRWR